MIASFNLDFDIAAAIVLFLEMIYVRLQYSHDKYSNRLFIMLLHSTLLLTIVDIASSLMMTVYVREVSHGWLRFACSMYYLLSAFVVMVFYRYIVEYLGVKAEKTVGYYVMTYFPFVFMLECLIANCFVNILFAGGKYGNFSYGPLITLIYFYPGYYFLLTIVRLIRSRKQISLKQVVPVCTYVLLTLSAMVLQFFFQNVMTMPFGFAISMLVLMLSLETPDYKKLMRTTEMLETVRDQMEYQDSFNKAFISTMANEICVPAGRLIDKNETYDLNRLDASQREFHEYVNGYGRMIRSVVNNIVELNTTGDAGMDSKAKAYAIKDLAYSVRDIMLPIAKDTMNLLTIDISPIVPRVLTGNELQLKQIMINLICNAIENTHNGTVSLEISGRRIESDSMNLVISVADTGKGMTRNDIRKMLQFNAKGKKWNKEYFDDGKFKIRITKRMVEDMYGKLHIDSTVNNGSKFTVVIPQGVVVSEAD